MKKDVLVCPRCNGVESTKAGLIRGKQRFNCKSCGFHFTIYNIVKQNWNRNERRKAVILYMEGFSYRAISRLLKVSHITVRSWIKQSGISPDLRNNDIPEILKCKEKEVVETIGEKCIHAKEWLLIGITKNHLGTYCLQTETEN
jgi:transposase-like protein